MPRLITLGEIILCLFFHCTVQTVVPNPNEQSVQDPALLMTEYENMALRETLNLVQRIVFTQLILPVPKAKRRMNQNDATMK